MWNWFTEYKEWDKERIKLNATENREFLSRDNDFNIVAKFDDYISEGWVVKIDDKPNNYGDRFK